MFNELNKEQLVLKENIYTYIENKKFNLPQEFSYIEKDSLICLQPNNLIVPKDNFEENMQVLVQTGYFLQKDENTFIYLGKKL